MNRAVTGSSGLVTARAPGRMADVAFRRTTGFAALLVIVLLGATAVFLIGESWSSLKHYGPFSFLASQRWAPSEAKAESSDPNPYGIIQFVYGTLLTSVIAILVAVPMSVGVALFITEIAPPRLRRPLGYLVDLLAAIPSVVYGFWGIFAFVPAIKPFGVFATETLGSLPLVGPLFAGPFFGVSYLTAGLVLAIMILPIITAICREVFLVAPLEEKEAAIGLGATKWEMVRMAVLPRSRSGIVGASILGLGRAFGETIAVTMLIGNSVLQINTSIFSQGATMPSVIANEFTEANQPFHLSSLFVVATWLLVLALVANFLGKRVVARTSKDIG